MQAVTPAASGAGRDGQEEAGQPGRAQVTVQLGSHVERNQLLPLLLFMYTGQAAIASSADGTQAVQRLAGKDVTLNMHYSAEISLHNPRL